MWKLNPVEVGGESYYLLPGKEYVVGRKNCEVLLQNDQSISRVHAHLTVSPQNINQKQPVELTVKDSSKYGTFVNEERLSNAISKVLRSGDRLTFGVFQSKFRVEYEPLVVCSSCVDSEGKAALLQAVQLLGGQLVNSWTQDCTHLVMSSVKVTIKTICALICCRPIVKPEYFSELGKALQQKLTRPKVESFYPEIDEPTLNKKDVDLNARPERKSLFQGKTFIFLSAKQQKRLSSVVAFGGGRSQLLEEGSLPLSILESSGSCVVDMVTGNSQALSSATTKWSDSVAAVLRRKGLRIIAESEIGLAAIYISTDNYCNPLSEMESETVRRKPSIPSATLSQSVAVDETVLPAISQNITAFAPNTEPSEGASRFCRLSTSGLSAVAETPEKQREWDRPLGKGALAKDPPLTSTVAETMMSAHGANAVATSEVQGEKSALMSRPKRDDPTAVKPPLTNGHKSRPSEKPSISITDYFQPTSKKRTREGSDPADYSEAKNSRRDAEENVAEQRDSAPQRSNPWRQTPQAAPVPEPCLTTPAPRGPSNRGSQGPYSNPSKDPNSDPPKESQQGRSSGEAVQRPPSNKRKEMASPDSMEEMEMEDLESIMSEPMEEQEVPATPSKKQRLETTVKIKQEEESFTEASKPEEGITLKQQREAEQENVPGKEETKVPKASLKVENGEDLPKNLLLIEFKSLIVSNPVRPRTGALQPRDANQKNFKKFRKAPVPGAQGLPNIIGGSDLVAHNRAKNSELEEWLREAAEEDKQNEREEALGDDLFRYNPKPSKRR
ncbi:nibrin [Anguilla anguilla]|uniref:nibrin n=1 Tax=Anguilla anguilla TaxID=7936 RepID=UPI0015AE620A|nr:nibrin [Anguilla anguilla]